MFSFQKYTRINFLQSSFASFDPSVIFAIFDTSLAVSLVMPAMFLSRNTIRSDAFRGATSSLVWAVEKKMGR